MQCPLRKFVWWSETIQDIKTRMPYSNEDFQKSLIFLFIYLLTTTYSKQYRQVDQYRLVFKISPKIEHLELWLQRSVSHQVGMTENAFFVICSPNCPFSTWWETYLGVPTRNDQSPEIWTKSTGWSTDRYCYCLSPSHTCMFVARSF